MRKGATARITMRNEDNAAWFFTHDNPDARDTDRANAITRTAMKAAVEVPLLNILDTADEEDDLDLVGYDAANGIHALERYYHLNEQVIARLEGRGNWDSFRLIHRQLSGLAVEFSHFADRRPEAPCKAFKARQLNRVLLQLKELMEEDMGVPLLLVSEEEEHSYSDVMVILRTYLDVSAAFVHRHYSGNTPVVQPVPCNWIANRVQDQILLFCMDQPRSITEIGRFLGYAEKKTTRKYLNPLLEEGLTGRTVPDKPNSRNQRCITLRTV